ncbi:hypothetical protein ACFQL0_01930 [Haloplanus litoreus]|uniref:hypothetical protein n=1 Tax=Haloplanus litoreus TaxID=767515 RepID=UPI0036197E29
MVARRRVRKVRRERLADERSVRRIERFTPSTRSMTAIARSGERPASTVRST